MQRLSQNLEKSFNLLLNKKTNNNRGAITTEIIKALLSGVKFNYLGRTINFSAIDHPPYTIKNQKGEVVKTHYGNDAFIQTFVDKVRSYKKAFPDNAFLKLLRIENDWSSGLSKLIVKDISGITTEFEELKIIENGFREIDSAERREYEGKFGDFWYSDFQFDFVKYLALAQGFRFGSTSYSWLLPPDIYSIALKELNSSFELLKTASVKHLQITPEYQAATSEEKLEMERLASTDEGMYNTVKDQISDFLALQIAKNNPEELSKLKFKDRPILFDKMKTDPEGNFYNLMVKSTETDAFVSAEKDDSDENEDIQNPDNGGEELQKKKTVSLFDNLPVIIKHSKKYGIAEDPSSQGTVTYILVKTGQDTKGNVYYQILTKASNTAHYQFDNNLLSPDMRGKYSLSKYFNSKTYYTAQENIAEQDGTQILTTDLPLKTGQSVMILKKGDIMRLYSDRYSVTELSREGKADQVKEYGKKMFELSNEKSRIQVSEKDILNLQKRISDLADTIRTKTSDKLERTFTSLQKELEEKSAKLAVKQELEIQLQELQALRKENLYVYKLQKESQGFTPEPGVQSIDATHAEINEEGGAKDLNTKCLPNL